MKKHSFIFQPGNWIGEGKITLNMVEEELPFNTSWTVQSKDFAGKVAAGQDVQIQGLAEGMHNDLTFYEFGTDSFTVDMENQNIGRIVGTGRFDENRIAWEFRNNDMNFEGFETYTLQPDGVYHMRGEYVTSDQYRTQIEAKIWIDDRPEAPTDENQSHEEGPF